MNKNSYIYFLTNQYNTALYVGVTNDILRRIAEHKSKINNSFTAKYNCDKLVYYELFSDITDAIAREKQIKNWKRTWKDDLINKFNPEWKDLSQDIGITNEIIESIKLNYHHSGESHNLS